ncbi:MAG TPA: hypothetical protein VHL53_11455 [Acidimicrobiia bacterium]|nr:hypothetical protein [Acidimicrobiia bacterium]
MFELNTEIDATGLQSVADVAGLHRRHRRGRRRSYYSNTCLVTGNGSLNGLNVLNILNGFGG